MMKPYFPDTKPLQADWYTNMATQFPALGSALGFYPNEITAWVADCRYAAFALGPMSAPFDAFGAALTGYGNTVVMGSPAPAGALVPVPPVPVWPASAPAAVAPGIDTRRQKTVERVKLSPNYTPHIVGQLLRLEPTGAPFDPAACQGQIRSAHEDGQGRALVAFSKAGGHLDGVNLYRQRQGDAAPVKVGQFTHTPALDATPLAAPGVPEERVYTVVPVIKDAEVGLRSAPVTLVMR